MNKSLSKIQSEWGANLRLRMMIYTIVITLMFYIFLWLIDIREEKLAQLNHNIDLLSKISVIQNEPEWFEREKEAASHRVKYQNQLWDASSKGLAQAKVQAYLNQLIKDFKIKNSKITLETVETIKSSDNTPSLWRVSAQVQGTFQINRLQKILWTLSTNQNLTTIRSLNFNLSDTRKGINRFTLYVDAWFDNSLGGNESE